MFKGKEGAQLDAIKEPETIIGPSMSVSGDFKGDGDVVVDGKVKGTLKTKKNVYVGETATINADIFAENGTIAGTVTGKVTIKDRLELVSGAKITGDVVTRTIYMEAGAKINGNVTMETEDDKKASIATVTEEEKKK